MLALEARWGNLISNGSVSGAVKSAGLADIKDRVSVVSVIEATAAALKICSTITLAVYKFIEEVKQIDQSLEGIKTDIKNLARVLETVNLSLRRFHDISQDVDSQANNEIIVAVNGSMEDCNASLKRLINILGEIRGAENRGQFFLPVQQTMRLKSSKGELEGCRRQIEGHKSSLHLSLTMIIL